MVPQPLQDQLRRWPDCDLFARCARLRTGAVQSAEHRATIVALRSTARHLLALEAEAHDLDTQLDEFVKAKAPKLRGDVRLSRC